MIIIKATVPLHTHTHIFKRMHVMLVIWWWPTERAMILQLWPKLYYFFCLFACSLVYHYHHHQLLSSYAQLVGKWQKVTNGAVFFLYILLFCVTAAQTGKYCIDKPPYYKYISNNNRHVMEIPFDRSYRTIVAAILQYQKHLKFDFNIVNLANCESILWPEETMVIVKRHTQPCHARCNANQLY